MGGPVQRLLAWATRAGVAAPAVSTFGVHGWPRLLATCENSSILHSIRSASGSNWSCSSSSRSTSSASSSSSSADAGQALGQEASSLGRKQRIVFLGTPQVAALVLERLLAASRLPGSTFEVAAVVSRPSGRHWLERERERDAARERSAATALAPVAEASGPQAAGGGGATCSRAGSEAAVAQATPTEQAAAAAPGRGSSGPGIQGQYGSRGATATNQPILSAGAAVAAAAGRAASPNWSRHGASAVERVAAAAGLPPDRIMCPVSAKEPGFLAALAALQPDLAVTAAYGALLPQSFLDLPRCGTLNIHPSLLPKYRGAAPVQRALQDGVDVSGVSLVFTVLKCDAGPVLEQQQVPVPPDAQAPQLSEQLFELGADMLLRHLPAVLQRGRAAAEGAARQDEAEATYAHKILRQEAYLDFRLTATQLHNTVRALAGWPGARATLLLEAKGTGTRDPIEIKILRTRVASADQLRAHARARHPPHATQQHHALHRSRQHPQSHHARTDACGTPAATVPPLPPGAAAQVVVTPAGELLVPCGDGSLLQILEVGRKSGGVGTATAPSKSLTAKEFVAGLARRRLYVPVCTGTGTPGGSGSTGSSSSDSRSSRSSSSSSGAGANC